MLTVACSALSLSSHAQDAATTTATPESVYTALTSRIDGIISQNQANADLTAKMYACNKLQMFYSPDAAGADAQGCIGGTGTGGKPGKWKFQSQTACSRDGGAAGFMPKCPDDPNGTACASAGTTCRLPMDCGSGGRGERSFSSAVFLCQ